MRNSEGTIKAITQGEVNLFDEWAGIDAGIVGAAEGESYFGSSGLHCSEEECYVGASELQMAFTYPLEASVWGSAA